MKSGFGVFCGLLVVTAAIVFITVPAQRKLLLVPQKDMLVYDLKDEIKTIGTLAQAQSVEIIRCEDRNKLIEPILRLPDGREGLVRDANFKITSVRTGLLSFPNFLNCGDR